ncbi:Wzz/FepE/Etk N-terminal domain-containing protein, partial [Halomonas sp. G15]|uniref:Wzz/FepE/Etk N-terminal domain-containing protein n=1 Tax=Halomonas sp. G15 TaxID=2903521 RepID=UPI001E3018FD|nr:Wzz/FepE/Etk N-terminal domain-containing protein [Halomonas sp. G15]
MSAKEEFDELSASDEIDLRDLVLAIFEGWYWIVGAVVVAVIASFTYVSAVTPVYTTELKFNGHPDGLRALNNMPGTSYTSGQVVAELSQRVGSYENFQRYLEESEETRVELFDYFDVGAGEEDAVEKVRRLFFANFSVSSSQ